MWMTCCSLVSRRSDPYRGTTTSVDSRAHLGRLVALGVGSSITRSLVTEDEAGALGERDLYDLGLENVE